MASCHEGPDEAVRAAGRHQLELPSAREPELSPAESLIVAFPGEQEQRAQRFRVERDRGAQIAHRDRHVIDGCIEHGAQHIDAMQQDASNRRWTTAPCMTGEWIFSIIFRYIFFCARSTSMDEIPPAVLPMLTPPLHVRSFAACDAPFG